MNILLSSNEKGGVGKSTVLLGIASALAKADKKVLIVELDRQSSIGGWLTDEEGKRLKAKAREAGRTTLFALNNAKKISECIYHTSLEGLDVICAGRDLNKPVTSKRLRALIAAVEDDYDFLLFDLRRDVEASIEDLNGINAKVIVPALNDAETLTGLQKVMDDLSRKCEFCLLFNQVQENTNAAIVNQSLIERDVPNLPVFQTRVHRSTKVSESTFAGQPLVQYSPRCRVSSDFVALSNEIIDWFGED